MKNRDGQTAGTGQALRKRAEELALAKASRPPEAISLEETQKIIHELRVHQIELEAQNEELLRTQEKLDAERERYFDFYNLAAVGYLTINEHGLILETNLTTAKLLGSNRVELDKQPINQFILKEDQDIYYRHRRQLMENGDPQTCELRMLKKDGAAFWGHLATTPLQDVNGNSIFRIVLSDITERKFQEESGELTTRLIVLINTPGSFRERMAELTAALQGWSGCEAVGLRLRDGGDFPYFETQGFSSEFVDMENHLCAYGKNGELLRDSAGNPVLECMCGNILSGKFNPGKPFFTAHGSFWTNSTSDLPAITTEAGRQSRACIRCNSEGYESVAMIPLREGDQMFGLLQFNDRRRNCFSPGLIEHCEKMADSLAIALAQRQSEEALRKSEERFGAFMSNLPAAAFIKDESGRILFVNKYLQKLLNLQDWDSKITHELIAGEMGRKMSADDTRALEHGTLKVQKTMTDALGVLRTFETIKFPISKEVKPAMLGGIAVDITDNKQKEEEIKLRSEELQKANAEKDKFFSIIAHDLRSPFQSFLSLTKEMAEEFPRLKKDEMHEIAVGMRDSAANLYRLIEGLLQWSIMQQGLMPFNPKAVLLLAIVNESVAMVLEPAVNKGIEITSHIPADMKVMADSNMLQSIIRNLVSNATKFTAKGGIINLSAKYAGDNNVEISIKDSGIGMSREMMDYLFRVDIRTKRKGTDGEPSAGLGLLLCKEFVEKQGGGIRVESKEGKGSGFYFTIPQNHIDSVTEKVFLNKASNFQSMRMAVKYEQSTNRQTF